MNLTKLQKKVVLSINSGEVYNLNSFIHQYLSDKLHVYTGSCNIDIIDDYFTFMNNSQQTSRFLDIYDKDNMRMITEYKSLIKKLLKNDYIYQDKPITNFRYANLLGAKYGKDWHYDAPTMNRFFKEYTCDIHATEELDFFIKNDFYTDDELQEKSVIEVARHTRWWTIAITLLIGCGTIYINYWISSPDRNVTIMNKDAIKVIDVTDKPNTIDTLVIKEYKENKDTNINKK